LRKNHQIFEFTKLGGGKKKEKVLKGSEGASPTKESKTFRDLLIV
jgi:hypothetical protein